MRSMNVSTYVVVLISLISLVHCGQNQATLRPEAQNRGILNGSTVPVKELSGLAPVLELGMGKDGKEGVCTATVVPGGQILTAQHCLSKYLGQGTLPELHIRSVSGSTWLNTLYEKDYKVSLPKAEASFTSIVGKDALGNPILEKHNEPDLALVQIKNDVLAEIKKLTSANIVTESLAVAAEDLKALVPVLSIAGVGLAPIAIDSDKASVGLLHTGMAKLQKVEDYYYALEYKKDGKFASALPGDSGGPLYSIGAKGEFQIHGVACSIKAEEFDPKTHMPKVITSRYTRLDLKGVQEWLKAEQEALDPK